MDSSANNRSIKNFLIYPLVQVRLGLYSILLAFFFAAAIFYILRVNLDGFAEIVISLTDAEDEVKALFQTYLNDVWIWVGVASVVFITLNIIVSIVFTHKLIGPSIAIQRQIKALNSGNYSHRIKLRKGDSFKEIAESLNELAGKLEKR